jgi:hypothetical protein
MVIYMSVNIIDIKNNISDYVWNKYHMYMRNLRRYEIDYIFRKINKMKNISEKDLWVIDLINSGIFDDFGCYKKSYMKELRGLF